MGQRRQCQPIPVLLPEKSHGGRRLVGCSPWRCWGSDTTERLHFHFHALEKGMAIHSSVLAWRIPGTGKPDGLPSMGSHRVGHDWSYLAAAAAVPIKLTTITERGGGKGKKKEKKNPKESTEQFKKNNKYFSWVTAVRVLSLAESHSPPYLPRMPSNGVLTSGPAVRAPQILIWSYSCVFSPPISTAIRTSAFSFVGALNSLLYIP